MTSNSLFNRTPTRDAANVLIAAVSGESSPGGDWIKLGLAVLVALSVATATFWLAARARDR